MAASNNKTFRFDKRTNKQGSAVQSSLSTIVSSDFCATSDNIWCADFLVSKKLSNHLKFNTILFYYFLS